LGSRVARGENLRCKVKVRNYAKVLVDATDITLVITDPKDAIVASKAMVDITQESTGIYYYDYTPGATVETGTYTALWDVTYAAKHRRSRGYFIVTE
jgi:hypothetical protein